MDPKWKPEYKEGVVYLHVIPRSYAGSVVNISPFAIKYELLLRMNGIPYETIDHMGMSSKGQSPFILWNGREIPDSNFGIEFLSKEFDKDPYPGLSPADRAVARSFLKMLEDSTAWTIFIYRYIEHTEEYAKYLMPTGPPEVREKVQNDIKTSLTNRANGHGIGRHSNEEIQKIGCDDIRAVSDFLGEKPYMIGDQPTLLDCAVFGILSQIVYVPMGFPTRRYLLENCQNIVRLMDRLKDKYWPDWDEQCKM